MKRVAAAAVLFLVAGVGGRAMATETLAYEVPKKFADFEVREYAPYVVAEAEVSGDRQEAGNAGFRVLADYIFGNNRGSKKIAMTAPVSQTAAGTKIAMTAPVTQVPAGEASFVVQFTMPAEYRLENLPTPNNDLVRLRQLPAKRVAVLRYSGTWSESRYQDHLAQLRSAMAREGLQPVGEPIWARYDPPFKPWFLRTNEILIEVRQ